MFEMNCMCGLSAFGYLVQYVYVWLHMGLEICVCA